MVAAVSVFFQLAPMTMLRKPLTVFPILAFALIGCSHAAQQAPFNVTGGTAGSVCTITVARRSVTLDELVVIARKEAGGGRRARVDWGLEEVPYRCLGGVMYTLQMAGFSKCRLYRRAA